MRSIVILFALVAGSLVHAADCDIIKAQAASQLSRLHMLIQQSGPRRSASDSLRRLAYDSLSSRIIEVNQAEEEYNRSLLGHQFFADWFSKPDPSQRTI